MTDMVIKFDFYGTPHCIDLKCIEDESSEFRFLDKMKHSLNDDLELVLSCVEDCLGNFNYYTASVLLLMKKDNTKIISVSKRFDYPDNYNDEEYFYPESGGIFRFFNETIHQIINDLDNFITYHIRDYENKIRSFVALRESLKKTEPVD